MALKRYIESEMRRGKLRELEKLLLSVSPRQSQSQSSPKWTRLPNNLTNITPQDQAYREKAQELTEKVKLPSSLGWFYDYLNIAVGDLFFLMYSLMPSIRADKNPDPLLEKLRNFLDQVHKSDEYARIRPITRLNSTFSEVYTKSFFKRFIEALEKEYRKTYKKIQKQMESQAKQGQQPQSSQQQPQPGGSQKGGMPSPSSMPAGSGQGGTPIPVPAPAGVPVPLPKGGKSQHQGQQGQPSGSGQTTQGQGNQQQKGQAQNQQGPMPGGSTPQPRPGQGQKPQPGYGGQQSLGPKQGSQGGQSNQPQQGQQNQGQGSSQSGPVKQQNQQNKPGQQGQQGSSQPQPDPIAQKAMEQALKNVMKKQLEDIMKKAGDDTLNTKDLTNLITTYGKEAGRDTIFNLADLVADVRVGEMVTKGRRLSDEIRFVSIRKVSAKHGTFEGVKLTGDPREALPKELAMPADLFYLKWAIKTLVGKDKKTLKEGHYYLLIDSSGSMEGVKDIWARSVGLAIVKKAAKRRRTVFLRLFSSSSQTLPAPNKSPMSTVTPHEFLELLLGHHLHGGTDIAYALNLALEDITKIKRLGVNTLILITDAEDDINQEEEQQLAEKIKKLGVRLITVVVLTSKENQAYNVLRRLSHEFMVVLPTEENALELVRIA